MSAVAKSRTSIFTAIKSLFSSEIDIEREDDIELPKVLSSVLEELKVKEKNAEKAINVVGDSKKGGFGKKINPKTEEAMRAMHNKIKTNETQEIDRERD